jgi:hypothetical protein
MLGRGVSTLAGDFYNGATPGALHLLCRHVRGMELMARKKVGGIPAACAGGYCS